MIGIFVILFIGFLTINRSLWIMYDLFTPRGIKSTIQRYQEKNGVTYVGMDPPEEKGSVRDSIKKRKTSVAWAGYVKWRSNKSKQWWFMRRWFMVDVFGDVYGMIKRPHYIPQFTRMCRIRVRCKTDHYFNLYNVRFWANKYSRKHLIPDMNDAITPSKRIAYHARKALPMTISAMVVCYLILNPISVPVIFSVIGMIGATYYVSYDNGDDLGTGAIDDPWKTMYELCRIRNTSAGDTVYFARGEVWQADLGGNDRFTAGANFGPGASGNEIVIDGGTWGSGDNAKIDGSLGDTITQVVWWNDGNRASYIYMKNFEVINTTGSSVTWRNDKATQLVSITFDTFTIDNAGQNSMVGGNFTDLLLTNCTVTNTDLTGIGPGTMTSGESENWTIRDCSVIQDVHSANDGIQCHEGQVKQARGPGLYLRCYAENFTEQSYDFTTGGYDGNDTALVMIGCDGSLSEGGVVFGHEHNYDLDDNGNVTNFCYSHLYDVDRDGDYFTIMFNSSRNIHVYNCLLECPDGIKSMCLADRQQTDNDGPVGCKFLHNTVIIKGDMVQGFMIGDRVEAGLDNGGITDFDVRNNLIYMFGSGNQRVFNIWSPLDDRQSETDINFGTVDYNMYYCASGTWTFEYWSNEGLSWNTWVSTYGHDTHSFNGQNPLLVDATGATSGFPDDAKIQVTSPAIGEAVAISSGVYYKTMGTDTVKVEDRSTYQTTGLTTDYYGVER